MKLCNTSFSASSQASPAPESQNINQQCPAVLKHGFTAGTPGTFQKVRMTALQARASFWTGKWPLPLLQAARRQLRALFGVGVLEANLAACPEGVPNRRNKEKTEEAEHCVAEPGPATSMLFTTQRRGQSSSGQDKRGSPQMLSKHRIPKTQVLNFLCLVSATRKYSSKSCV